MFTGYVYNEQSTRIIFNTLEGNYALCLLGMYLIIQQQKRKHILTLSNVYLCLRIIANYFKSNLYPYYNGCIVVVSKEIDSL